MAENLTPLEKNTQTLAEIKTMVDGLPEANTSTITGLSVGDIIEITAVDSNGTPTAWTKVAA